MSYAENTTAPVTKCRWVEAMGPKEILSRLTPPQRHIIRRCSDAQEWGVDHGMARTWPDVVAGRKRCSFRSIRALAKIGIVTIEDGQQRNMVRLTALGLSVQLWLRQAPNGS